MRPRAVVMRKQRRKVPPNWSRVPETETIKIGISDTTWDRAISAALFATKLTLLSSSIDDHFCQLSIPTQLTNNISTLAIKLL